MNFKLWIEDAKPHFDDQAIRDVENQSSKSREMLVTMNIADFLKMAEPLDTPSHSKFGGVKDLLNKNVKFNSVPFLAFEHDGKGTAKVVSHEGRHRAIALQQMGYTTIPVKFVSYGTQQGGAIRWGSQYGFDKLRGVWPKVLIGQDGTSTIRFPVPESNQ